MGVFTSGAGRRSRSLKSILGGIAVVGASALVLSGCAPAESEEPAAPAEDLTLKIGTILPQSGALAFLGPPEEAGVALAVQEVNEAGLGITVEAIYRDSGDTTTIRVPLAILAAFLDRLGCHEPAATVAGFAFDPLTAAWVPEITLAIAHLRDVLGDQTYESLARKGQAMSTAAMAMYAYDQIDQARTELDAVSK